MNLTLFTHAWSEDVMTKLTLILSVVFLCSACEFSKDLNVDDIEGYKFSLFDIQEHCTVNRDGDRHLAITCDLPKLKPVVRSCEGNITAGLVDPKFYCSGGLWKLNDICYVEMLNTNKGNIRCKKQ